MWVAVSCVCCCSNIPIRTVQVLSYFGYSRQKLVIITTTDPAMLNINCICMLHLYCIVPLAGLISPPSCPCRFRIASTSPPPLVLAPSVQRTLDTVQPWVSSRYRQPFLPVGPGGCRKEWTALTNMYTCSHTHTHTHRPRYTHTTTHTDPMYVRIAIRFHSTHASPLLCLFSHVWITALWCKHHSVMA